MVFLLVLLDSRDDCCSPLDDKILEAIALIKVSIHELLHGLPRQPALLALLVKLCLLLINVID